MLSTKVASLKLTPGSTKELITNSGTEGEWYKAHVLWGSKNLLTKAMPWSP